MSCRACEKTIPENERWGTFRRLFLIYAVLALGAAFLSQWMPGAEGAKRVLTRIWGPALTDTYPTSGRDQITVMLIDDKDLREYGEVWPVSLGFHGRRLLELVKYQPKAVFFDIVFLDDRKDPELDGFIDAACTARRAGIPVFIGSFGNANFTPSRTESAMLARRVDAGGQAAPCIEAAYLNMRIDGYDQSVWEYDVNVPALARDDAFAGGTRTTPPAPQQVFPSPAARLYQVDHTLDPSVGAEPMALVWGTASDPRNLEWLNSDMRPGGPGAVCSASWRLQRMSPIGEPSAPICPYQQLLPMRTLKRTHGLDSGQLDEAIRQKYVIYGTHLQSNGDVVLSPYHGRIAGAFLHAMALDNLLSFKGNPKSGGDFGRPWISGATGFTLIAVAAISALIAAKALFPIAQMGRHPALHRLAKWNPDGAPLPRKTRRRAAFGEFCLALKTGMLWLAPRLFVGIVLFVTICLLILVSYSWMGLGPLVWIEYALFPIAMGFLHLGEDIAAFLKSAWNYVRHVGKSIVAHDDALYSAALHRADAHVAPEWEPASESEPRDTVAMAQEKKMRRTG